MRGADAATLQLGCYILMLGVVVGWWAFVVFVIVKTAQHFGIF